MTEASRMILECRMNTGSKQIATYRPPIHGADLDQQTKAWELVLSIVQGLKDGSYTLNQVQTEAQQRLGKLQADPLSLKELKAPKQKDW
jgi:hypothetical protein